MTEFRVRPSQLRADGSALIDAAAQLVDIVQQAVSAIQSAGAPWGGDDIGMIIGETHDVVAGALLDFFADAVDAMRSDGSDLMLMADRYDAVEQGEQQRFDHIGQQLGS